MTWVGRVWRLLVGLTKVGRVLLVLAILFLADVVFRAATEQWNLFFVQLAVFFMVASVPAIEIYRQLEDR